jgi:glycosyltransferase involved in cell wall biosynthesis
MFMLQHTASRQRKILYVMDALYGGERIGGTEGQVLQLLTHLDRSRFEPRLALFRPTPYVEQAGALPCPVDLLHIDRLLAARTAVKLLRLSAFIRRTRTDLVHIFLNDAAVAGPLFCRLGGAKVIVSRRDMGFWYTETTLRVLRLTKWFVSRVIANSNAVRRNVHEREGYPLTQIDVCYNGHDPRRFDVEALKGFREARKIGPADPIVGMVANFNPWKRHVDLVEAFARVRQRHAHAHLVLVGTGAVDECRDAVRRCGIESFVHFCGGVTDPIPIVKHFNVAVLCSESEGFSNAVIEYMGAGKASVCTNVGGNAELLQDGETGFLINPFDVQSLADRISLLLATPDVAQRIGERALKVAHGLTSRRMVDAHLELYERLLH